VPCRSLRVRGTSNATIPHFLHHVSKEAPERRKFKKETMIGE